MLRIPSLRNAVSLALLFAATFGVVAQPAAQKLARPTTQQAAWHDCEIGMFIHFGPATWQDVEYDTLGTPLERINPDKLDTDQWVSAAEAMGAKYIVFVAKHTGGFCWWQTDTTDYGVRNIPWRDGKGDVMNDLAEACRKRGIKLGVYLSPNDAQFGAGGGGRCKTPEAQARYDKIFRQQLTELLSRYGEMFEVWFDGSSMTDVGDLLQQYAPKAMVFQGPYATIRWVGNEDGVAPYPNWNSLPLARAKSGVSTGTDGHPDGDAWMPNECDARIRATWFWNSHGAGTLKSLDQLMSMYYQSVGRGAVLLLNMTPDTTGLMPEADVRRAAEFGAEIRQRFSQSIAEISGQDEVLELDLGRPAHIDHVITMENIVEGERVREYVIEGLVSDQWKELCRGSSIGQKKIDQFPPTEVSKVRLRVVKSAAEPQVRKLAAYAVREAPQAIGEKGAAGAATKVWEWSRETVGNEWQTVDIDLTTACREACVYQVDFMPAAGTPPLDVQSLTLLMDGIALQEFTVPVERSSRYDVTITGLSKSLALRAILRASGEQKDSQGTLTIRKKLAGPTVSSEGGPAPHRSTDPVSFTDMHLGLFAHYTYVGKPYQWGATEWADGTMAQSLDELADNLDVENFAATAAAMRAQYVIFTTSHANMNALWPSETLMRRFPGHYSRRDALGDLIRALKVRNIRMIFYIHPSVPGPDFTREDQDRFGWNDGPPWRRWNDFYNEYLAEMVERYGKDVSGYYIDGGLPEQVDAPRLRKTILDRQPDAWLIQNSGLNRACVDYGARERMEAPYPSTTWLRCQTITEEWWARRASVQWRPEQAYRYTILQAAVSGRLGGGVAWSFGPRPGGKWEEGVPSFCERLGVLVDRAGASLFGTRPSRAYVTQGEQDWPAEGPPLNGLSYCATESPDGKKTFVHVFLPPKERSFQLPVPADGRRFSSARLLDTGRKVSLLQTDTGLRLTLDPADHWDEVDTIIVLE